MTIIVNTVEFKARLQKRLDAAEMLKKEAVRKLESLSFGFKLTHLSDTGVLFREIELAEQYSLKLNTMIMQLGYHVEATIGIEETSPIWSILA